MTEQRSRRQLLIWAGQGSLAAGSMALLAACTSSGGGGSAAPTSAPAAQATAAPAAAAQPTQAAPAAVAQGDINLYVGGDVNIRDLWQKQLLPAYAKVKPDVKFSLVFDEHALSEQAVFDKLAAAKQAGAV